MRRRIFLVQIAAAASMAPGAWAQQDGRKYQVGVLLPLGRGSSYAAILEGLKAMGFVEGKNLVMDGRGYDLRPDQFAAVARELAEAKVDLILAGGGPAIKAAQAVTDSIPIVGFADDMVGEGLVQSLANREGNTTGISILAAELDGKRQEVLMELLPKAKKLAVLADARLITTAHRQTLEERARSSGVSLSFQLVAKPEDVEPALEAIKADGAAAVNILASPLLFQSRERMFARAKALRLPSIYQWPEGTTEGALVAYGPDYAETFGRWGRLAGKVLRGAKPRELPVEQPTRFLLAINLGLARQFGIEVAPAMLQRADEVIE
jgi:putative tryptophan/tyrosine transport system substrate-binding protein